MNAMLKVPAGYTFDGNVQLTTPLTAQTFTPVTTHVAAQSLIIAFDKALLDNNLPAGDAVPLTLTANFIDGGVQKKLSATATVRVVK